MYFHPLNFIRFLLALGVLLFHYGFAYFPFNLPVLKTLILNSAFRVSFFFFISGFVMTLVYAKPGLVSPSFFYKRRLSRIMPLYLIAFVITLLVVLFIKQAGPKGLVIVLHALGLQSWYPGFVLDLNFTTWSISVEFVFYAVFPLLLPWFMRQSSARLAGTAVLVWILQSIQHFIFVNYLSNGTKAMEEFISAFPLWHLPTFFSGMVCARLAVQQAVPSVLKKRPLISLLLALGIFAYILYMPNPILKYIHNGLLSPLFAMVILGLYFDRSVLSQVLSLAPFRRLGDLSYGIFIFQYPVWVVFTAMFDLKLQAANWFFYLYLAAVLLVSFCMNRFVEAPLRERLRR